MLRRLVTLAGPDEGRVFELGDVALLVGRSRACEIRLTDPHVSRIHFQLFPSAEGVQLEDYESAAGTYVDGVKTESSPLRPGALIRAGTTHMQYLEEEVPAEPPIHGKGTSIDPWASAIVGARFGNYDVGSILARGRTGVVFHATDVRSDVPVSLKILNPAFTREPDVVSRFSETMKKVMTVKDRQILQLLGAGKQKDQLWIASEYQSAESLAAVVGRVAAGQKLDWRNILRLGYYLAGAVRAAHENDLLHLRITPHNVLLGRKPADTKLSDLGLAESLREDPLRPVSAAGLASEALPYLAPEQTDGPDAVFDAQTDIYSLGATLYALFTGSAPFKGDTVAEAVDQMRFDAPAPLASLVADLPLEVSQIFRRMLGKRPQDRPSRAAEIETFFESVLRKQQMAP